MRVISRAKLRAFAEKHPDARAALDLWYHATLRAAWTCHQDVTKTYRTADPVGATIVVFNICGNAYRLIVRTDYAFGIVFIDSIRTHAEYDRLDLKALDTRFREDRQRRIKKRGSNGQGRSRKEGS